MNRRESDFCIFPDGTSMLIDSGDYSLAFIPAKDESMIVRDVLRFRSFAERA